MKGQLQSVTGSGQPQVGEGTTMERKKSNLFQIQSFLNSIFFKFNFFQKEKIA